MRWNNTPVHDLRTVFMVAPKCGNTSVKRAIQQKFGLTGNPHAHMERWSPAQVAGSDYLRIAICRNPYARAVSLWWEKSHHKAARNRSFYANTGLAAGLEFLPFLRAVADMADDTDIHVAPQWLQMVHNGKYLPHHTFRLEDPATWARVQKLVALPDLGRHNASRAPDWRVMCVGEAARLVESRWARDFELFGYEMLRRR